MSIAHPPWNDTDDDSTRANPLARRIWRQAVRHVAEHAKTVLPDAVNGRVEKAIGLTLRGDVDLRSDDHAIVGSESDTITYEVHAGLCQCKDATREDTDGWCKHRIAERLTREANVMAKEQLDTFLRNNPEAPPQTALPEAPVSANTHIDIAGHRVQLTIRAGATTSDVDTVLREMERVVQYYATATPIPPAPTNGTPPAPSEAPVDTPPEAAQCPYHNRALKYSAKHAGMYCSAKNPDGTWCNYKIG